MNFFCQYRPVFVIYKLSFLFIISFHITTLSVSFSQIFLIDILYLRKETMMESFSSYYKTTILYRSRQQIYIENFVN